MQITPFVCHILPALIADGMPVVQVSMRLKLGVMWDHNGTYMDGIGVRFQDHNVIAELGEDDNIEGAPPLGALCWHSSPWRTAHPKSVSASVVRI
jgi:hypothetical protein